MNLERLIGFGKAIRFPARSVAHLRCVQDNLGDILVGLAIEQMLRPLMVLTGANSRQFRNFDRIVGLRRAFGSCCLGGGTLIFAPRGVGWLESVELFSKKTTPLCSFGTGVIDPEFRGHLSSLNSESFTVDQSTIDGWLECLSRFRFVSVRGVESARILEQHGFRKSEVIGDPALFYARSSIKPKNGLQRVGINISDCLEFWSNSQQKLTATLVEIMRWFRDKHWEVTLFPTEPKDVEISRDCCNKVAGVTIRDVHGTPGQFIDEIETHDLFIGTKLHSVICAFCAYTPAIMVGYQPKCLDFMSTMGFTKHYVRSDNVDTERMIDLVEDIQANVHAIQKEQFDTCQRFRNRLLDFRERVLASMGIQSPLQKAD